MKPAESSGCPIEGAYQTSDKFTSSEVHCPSNGSVDEDNTLLDQGKKNGPECELQFGEDGKSDQIDFDSDDDSLVDVEKIVDRFKLASMQLRGKTPVRYIQIFKRFNKAVNISQYTKRQLAGSKGKEILLSYLLSKVPLASRRVQFAGLKAVWTEGLNLPYPILKRHLGELPDIGERQSPRDSDVKPWIKAIEHEEDVYLKSIMLIIFQLGIRPSHVCLLRWKHVRRGLDGKPESIMTTGREEGNKRMVPIKARLPPDLAEALIELKKVIPEASEDDPIIPRRTNGKIKHDVATMPDTLLLLMERFGKRHLLYRLRPVDLRHWVAKIADNSGLSYASTNAMQGHKCFSRNMRDHYAMPDDEEIFAEQARILPHGPIGVICPKVEITPGIPEEALSLLSDYLARRIGTMDFANRIEIIARELNRPAENMAIM